MVYFLCGCLCYSLVGVLTAHRGVSATVARQAEHYADAHGIFLTKWQLIGIEAFALIINAVLWPVIIISRTARHFRSYDV